MAGIRQTAGFGGRSRGRPSGCGLSVGEFETTTLQGHGFHRPTRHLFADRRRLDANTVLRSDSRVASLGSVARKSIDDGWITEEESEDICQWITTLVGDSATDTGLATFGNIGVIDGALEDPSRFSIPDRMFVLTGKFAIGPRKVLAGMISERGRAWKNTVCGATDYLVVAAEASREWKHSHEGTKIIRAMEFRHKGGRPDLVHEPMLASALSLR